MNISFTLHDLPATERPRERLVEHGVRSLSTPEILALVLGRGTQGEPVMQLAQVLLKRFGSLRGITAASLEDLQSIKGIGVAKACQLQACAEIARRMEISDSATEAVKIVDPSTVRSLVWPKISQYHKEHYVLLSLDVRSRLLGIDALSVGTLDAALVHPRETFEMAIRRHAARVVLCHNHPSEIVEPSDDDLAVTKRLVTAGKILGISVVDHVVISDREYYSMQEHGQI